MNYVSLTQGTGTYAGTYVASGVNIQAIAVTNPSSATPHLWAVDPNLGGPVFTTRSVGVTGNVTIHNLLSITSPGQTNSLGSLPVVLASDQSRVNTSPTASSVVVIAGHTPIRILDSGSGNSTLITEPIDDLDNTNISGLQTNSFLSVFGGSTWSRVRGYGGYIGVVGSVTENTILASNNTIPVIVGGRVGSSDFANPISSGYVVGSAYDSWGRSLTSHIPHEAQKWRAMQITTTQTGSALWTAEGGHRIALTSVCISSYGSTSARVILWTSGPGDVTYTAGTDQLIWAGSFAPGISSFPGVVLQPTVPIFTTSASSVVRITTDAAISLDVALYGYEF
jgi:hypothetical protein